MKALSPSDLQSILDSEIVWRRRELTTLVTLAQTIDIVSQNALIRSAIPLLYAHWEGFGRACAVRYLEYVSYRSKRFRDLKPAFSYLALLPHLKDIAGGSAGVAIPLLNKAYARLDEKNRDPFRKRISTKSNLRFEVLCEMLSLCGIESTPFNEYELFIDRDLCDPRNDIAHGAGGAPPLDELIRRRNRTFELMMRLQNEFVNAAATSAFML